MSSERLSPVEIEAMKERINESLEDCEASAFALEMFIIDWRIRQAEKRKQEATS